MNKFIIGLCATFFLLPGLVSAYQVLDTNVYKLTEDTYLYTIDYRLGFEKYKVEAPIGATSGQENPGSLLLNYQLQDEEGSRYDSGLTSALVLSDAKVEDNRYIVPKGESRDFTLVALLTVPADSAAPLINLKVTALPFNLIDDTRITKNGLSVGELSYYLTTHPD